ncbi:hypothetical protein UO65_2838 [Actinokineospora spheciospongiae]|uniref:Uncharacterized protein n=1 Tax=Actinokineospora spheciospongiae TaxID=909613 RepID=W7ILW9_9PSEU|nr:hypothetical protein [Actinokineospora spheciospongiae]EWC61905.1 hypothetical protein UO65_2838 [Actinokineospora spheciospongiae]
MTDNAPGPPPCPNPCTGCTQLAATAARIEDVLQTIALDISEFKNKWERSTEQF